METETSAETPTQSVAPAAQPAHDLPGAFKLFKPSVRAVSNNLPAYLWLSGVPLVIVLAAQIVQFFSGSTGKFSAPYLLLAAVGGILSLVVAPALILLQLRSVRKQPAAAAELFQEGLKHLWRLVGLGIVISLGLLVSFLALIVPFFFVLPRVVLAPYFLIDQNFGVFDALRASNEAYKRRHGIYGILGVSFLFGIVTAVPIVGTIGGSILNFLYQPAFGMRYEQLKLLDGNKPPQTPVEAELAAKQQA